MSGEFVSLESLKEPFEQYLVEIQTVKVETAEEYEAAAMGLKALKGWQKDITDYFEPYRLRTYEAYNNVTTTKASYLKKAESVEKVIKSKMAEFQLAEQLRIRKEQEIARAAEAAALRELQASLPTPDAPATVSDVVIPEVSAPTKVAGISVTKTWKYRITDLNAIKKEFWSLNEALVLKVVKDLGKDAERVVGGIVVEEDIQIGSRSR
jgi:hypothetical protein